MRVSLSIAVLVGLSAMVVDAEPADRVVIAEVSKAVSRGTIIADAPPAAVYALITDYAAWQQFLTDSPAVFCRLLDADRGGTFRVAPRDRAASSRRYVGETAILETTHRTSTGVVRVTDLMHVRPLSTSRLGVDAPDCHRILRIVDGVAGRVELDVSCLPTFEYGLARGELEAHRDTAIARHRATTLRLECPGTDVRIDETGAIVARLSIGAGDRRWIVLSHADGAADPCELACGDPERLLDETIRHWTRWSATTAYDGPYRELVRTSARVLELLTFGPTGAIVAAPTTSLPEQIGGVRNWDYRFS